MSGLSIDEQIRKIVEIRNDSEDSDYKEHPWLRKILIDFNKDI